MGSEMTRAPAPGPKRGAKGEPSPTTPDPIEIAMEAEKSDRSADSPARRLLIEQERLIGEQIRLTRLERLGRRLATVRDVALMLGVIAMLTLAVGVVWGAATSRSVVVEPFETPPALASRGVSGRAAAQAVSDRIAAIQAATRSRVTRKFTTAWSQEIRLETPGVGLSLGEVERLLRDRLGHNVKLGGTLVQEPDDGLALTVRGDGILARTFRGGPGDYAKLAGQAAEYLFGAAEPNTMIRYLFTNGRAAEALPLWTRTMARATAAEQTTLLVMGGDIQWLLTDYDASAALYRQAIARGETRNAADNLTWVLAYAGREEDAVAFARSARRTRDALASAVFLVRQDWGSFHEAWRQNDAVNRAQGGIGGVGGSLAPPMMAYAAARLHDWAEVRADLLNSDPDHPSTVAMVSLIEGMRALDEGRPADAVAPLTAYAKMWREDERVRYDLHDPPCRLARALALIGRSAEAETVIGQTGRYVECYAARADAFEAAGDRAGADRAYAAAIALAPSAAFAYDAYGQALLGRGDLDGALAQFGLARARAPRWADPLKGSGDVLARQGRWRPALTAYDQALGLAPHWPQLRQARAQAAKHAAKPSAGAT